MCRITIIAASILLLICSMLPGAADAASSNHAGAKASAVKAANAWLKVIDEGKYDDSWKDASSYFRSHVSEKQWAQQVGPARGSLGAVVSRKVTATKYLSTMAGAPDGQYVVILYETSFAHKKSAFETVTPMLESDGRWRVSGYYIK
jgi:hypothetical protein